MHDREILISAFLTRAGFEGALRRPVAGDASSRQYSRIGTPPHNAILMNADPATGQETGRFAEITRWLAGQGLSPPDIIAHDAKAGLMLITDLGETDVATRLAKFGQDAAKIYTAIGDVLIHLHHATPPAGLPQMTPEIAGQMVEITGTHYMQLDDGGRALSRAVTQTFARLAPRADQIALRDFHAENLIWRENKSGFDRVGLLDYQDAFIAPAGYDLASLLRDVRRDVSPQDAQTVFARFAAGTQIEPTQLEAQLACLGAQRNLRILGVFARLANDMGKPRYLTMMPRVWNLLMEDLAHPQLADLAQAVRRDLQPPQEIGMVP